MVNDIGVANNKMLFCTNTIIRARMCSHMDSGPETEVLEFKKTTGE